MAEKKSEKLSIEDLKISLENLLKAIDKKKDKKDDDEKEIRETALKALVVLSGFLRNFAEEKVGKFKTEVVSKAESLFNSAFGFTKELVEDLVEKAEDVFDSVDYKKEEEDRLRDVKEAEGKKSEDELLEIRSKTSTESYNNLVKAGFCIMTAGKIVSEISRDMFDKPLGNPQCEKLYANFMSYDDDDEDGLKHTKELAAAMLDMAKK